MKRRLANSKDIKLFGFALERDAKAERRQYKSYGKRQPTKYRSNAKPNKHQVAYSSISVLGNTLT